MMHASAVVLLLFAARAPLFSWNLSKISDANNDIFKSSRANQESLDRLDHQVNQAIPACRANVDHPEKQVLKDCRARQVNQDRLDRLVWRAHLAQR